MQKITLKELRKQVKIEDIISKYVKLEQKGKYLKAICPFHNETEPSFTVTPERNQYYCFGCKAKGDAFDFLMKYNNYSFMDALQEVSEFYNVKLDNKHIEMSAKKQAIFDINYMFMVDCINQVDKVKKYLYFRDLNDNTIQKYSVGYCDDTDSYEIYNKLSKKFTKEQIESSNLFSIYQYNIKSIFKGRIVIPIKDNSNNVIGFGARRIDDKDSKSAKYMNSFNNIVFDKSKILYGIDKDVHRKISCKDIILVEGYFDVLMLNQIGVYNVFGLNGTSISNHQIDLLKEIKDDEKNIVLILDGDKAGISAMLKMTDDFIKNDIDIKLVVLHDELDPCEFIQKNEIKTMDEFEQYIKHHKKDGLCCKIDMILRKYNLKDTIEKQKAFNYIENWLSSFDKYFIYEKGIEHLIAVLDIDYEKFMKKFNKKTRNDFIKTKENIINYGDELTYQLRLIKLFIRYPDELYEYIDNIPIELVFTKPTLRKIFRGLLEIIRVKDYSVLYDLETTLSDILENFNESDKKAIKLIKNFTEKSIYEDSIKNMMETLKLIKLSQVDKEIQKIKKSIDNITELDEKMNILAKLDVLTDKKNRIKMKM